MYNEEVNDLLDPANRKLAIKEDPEEGVKVSGLREECVTSPQDVLTLLAHGEAHRHFGETKMNTKSSRSHTIFRMVGGQCSAGLAEDSMFRHSRPNVW